MFLTGGKGAVLAFGFLVRWCYQRRAYFKIEREYDVPYYQCRSVCAWSMATNVTGKLNAKGEGCVVMEA